LQTERRWRGRANGLNPDGMIDNARRDEPVSA